MQGEPLLSSGENNLVAAKNPSSFARPDSRELALSEVEGAAVPR